MSRPVRLLVLQLVIIFLISIVSAYELPDYSQINQDIALFLTPFGIAKNLADRASVLHQFYFEAPTGQEQLTQARILLMIFLYGIMLLNFVWIRKGLRRR